MPWRANGMRKPINSLLKCKYQKGPVGPEDKLKIIKIEILELERAS